jgi:nucleotide-binding universal stress UspA family protein
VIYKHTLRKIIKWGKAQKRATIGYMFKRVLLCYDGSEAGRRALKRGTELAILLGAQVHVLSIISSGVANAAVIASATGHACLVDDSRGHRKLLDESLEWLKARGVAAEGYLATGNTLDQIAAYAKRLAVDLIVLGHYPQPAGGFWWSGPQHRASLAERAGCCVFVAVSAENQP